jgi:hypothetical protein
MADFDEWIRSKAQFSQLYGNGIDRSRLGSIDPDTIGRSSLGMVDPEILRGFISKDERSILEAIDRSCMGSIDPICAWSILEVTGFLL